MTDFTKEELIDIFECVSHFKMASARGGFSYYDDLTDKVESLIDNYCEHQFTEEQNGFLYCHLCGAKRNE